MADNTRINSNTTTGDLIADDELTTINGNAAVGEKAQRVKLGWGLPHDFNDVSNSKPLPIAGAQFTATSGNIAAGATGTIGPADVSKAGNVTFIVKNQVAGSAYTGAPVIVFEQSDDSTSWTLLPVNRADTGTIGSTQILPAGAANAEFMFDAPLEGVGYVRARVTTGPATNPITIVIQPGGMAFMPYIYTIDKNNTNRTAFTASVTGAATGTTGVEQILSMIFQQGSAANPAAASSFNIPAGKTLRINYISFSQVGNATATLATTKFNLRLNTSGAVTATSTPILATVRLGTPATANAYAQYILDFTEGYEIQGGTNVNIGVSVNSTFVTNAPTVDCFIEGYLY